MTRGIAALTGGTGFIGRVCAVSLAAAGWRVRMLARRDPTHPVLATTPFEVVLGDLEDEAALARLVRGADAVVHAAGAIRGRNDAAFLAVNRDGTGRLSAIAARDAPSARFVLLSSQAARCPGLSPYAASKLAGETAIRDALGAGPWIILRPGIVYGPWDEATQSLLRLANLPLVPVPAPPEPRLTMIHVSDVAAAVVAFCAGGSSRTIHELSDSSAPDGHAWREIVACATARTAPRFVTVPDALLLAAGRAADAWSRLAQTPSIFGHGKASEILHRDWRPDPALGVSTEFWRAEMPLRAGVQALYRPSLTLTHGRPGALPLDPAGEQTYTFAPPRPPRS